MALAKEQLGLSSLLTFVEEARLYFGSLSTQQEHMRNCRAVMAALDPEYGVPLRIPHLSGPNSGPNRVLARYSSDEQHIRLQYLGNPSLTLVKSQEFDLDHILSLDPKRADFWRRLATTKQKVVEQVFKSTGSLKHQQDIIIAEHKQYKSLLIVKEAASTDIVFSSLDLAIDLVWAYPRLPKLLRASGRRRYSERTLAWASLSS